MYEDSSFSKHPLISAIIPVWNPGPGIDRCIKSLRSQTLKNIEMIFVDDRGTDDAMDKVREAAKEDPRIHILENPENIGAGPSRNKGIEAAQGEFLSFIDPDDYISVDFYEMLYTEAVTSDADIAKGICIYQKEDGRVVDRPFRLIDVIRDQMEKGMPLYTSFVYEHWSAIYHKGLFADGETRYGNTRHDQDTLFLLRVCSKTENIVLCEKAKYVFCCRSNSAMHRIAADGWDDMAKSFDVLMDFIIQKHCNDESSCIYMNNILKKHLRRYYSMKDISGLKPGYRNHLTRVRNSVLRFPSLDKLKKTSFPVRVLVDYEICLPDDVFSLPWNQKKLSSYFALAADHIRFVRAHPQFTLKCGLQILKLLRNALRSLTAEGII